VKQATRPPPGPPGRAGGGGGGRQFCNAHMVKRKHPQDSRGPNIAIVSYALSARAHASPFMLDATLRYDTTPLQTPANSSDNDPGII